MWKANSPLRKAQSSLPQLPIINASEHIPLLLQSLEPLAKSKEEFERTKSLILDFESSPVTRELQAEFETRGKASRALVSEFFQKETTQPESIRPTLHPDGSNFPNNHWLEQTWEDMAYLAWQDSISCFSNVFTTLFDSTPCEQDPLLRAAWTCMGLLDFGNMLLQGELTPDPKLCSAQYLKCLFTTRLPGVERDRVITRPFPLVVSGQVPKRPTGPFADRLEFSEGAHICVLVKRTGNMYQLDVTNATCEEIYLALKSIQSNDAQQAPAPCKVADLTGMRRDDWCQARIRLMSSSTTSAATLRSLEEAVFHLVLSDLAPVGARETMLALQEARGAWLDKSTTIISFQNGVLGANLEHAACDAVVPSRMLVHANEFASSNCPEIAKETKFFANSAKTAPIRKLHFNQTLACETRSLEGQEVVRCVPIKFDVDTPTIEDCANAAKQLQAIYSNNQLGTVDVRTVGLKDIKKAGMAPDSFMQMALQLAYGMDQQGATPPTYETASTRAFFHGRTECIRSQSAKSREFVSAYLENANSPALKPLLIEAGKAHRTFLSAASNGKGPDRHMLMMQILSTKLGKPKHALFSDPLYLRGTGFELSTSQLPWAVYDHPGFGAPFENAYGCCYRFSEDRIVAAVTSRTVCTTKNAIRFAATIEKAVHELMRILTTSTQAKL